MNTLTMPRVFRSDTFSSQFIKSSSTSDSGFIAVYKHTAQDLCQFVMPFDIVTPELLIPDTMLASEDILRVDWGRPEEDEAWATL